MSSNLTHESGDQVLAGRSLVVVLREKKTDLRDSELQAQGNVESAQRDNSVVATLQHQPQLQAQTEPSSKRTGSDIFNDFICENKNCYWNPHLEESICNLKYIGYLHPTTLLVGGRDIYVDTVRGAWTRRVLRPPRGFHIVRVGDLESMETQPVHQTQFTPLPEALCLAITDLNRTHSPATFDVIQRALAHTYRRVHPPSEEIIYETLGSLIREHKIVYSGGSYFAMTPDLHMVHTNCIVVHDNHLVIAGDSSAPGGAFPTLFIPLGVTTEKRSISCQTDGVGKSARTKSDRHKLDSSMSSHNTTDDDPVNQRKLFERSRSVRESRSKKEKIDSLSRSESLRYSGERSRQLVKDINLKTSAAHQNKGKGEKTSLLSKLFGRSSNKKRSLSVGDKGRSHKIEHATFSAQFPPPDLAIQVSRMQLQRHCAATLRQDVATQSEVNGEDEDYGYSQLSPVHMRHTEVVEPLRGWASDHSRESSRGGEFLDSRALSKSTKRDRSVTKSHSKRNTESNPMAKHKGHDLKEVVLHKQNTDCDVFAPCRRRDPGHTQNTQVSAFAMSTQHKLSETALHKRNVRSSTKSTRKDLTLLHCQMDVHQKHASRSCKQECDAEKWGYESKHVSRSCHQDVIVASPCGERNSELKHLQKGARQNHRTPVNERRTMSSMQNNVAVSHVVEGNESHNVDLGRKQMRRRSRRMTHEEEYCHEMCPRDPVMRHDVNDTVTQWNSPATLLNNGCPEAEHMAERDGHRLRVFQKYREMYCGSTLDNGGDANADLPLKTHGISRDSGVNFVGLATPRIHKYPTSSLGGGAGDAMECLQDSGFNSPRGLQLTPARSIPLAPGDSMTFVQNLRHLPDVPTDRQPCPAGGTASPRWCSTDVGDAGSFSWSSSSRQTVRPTGESSPQSHPKSSLGLARHKQTVWTSPEPVTMATKCADNQMDADKKGQVRPRDRSPKKHIVGIHGDHHQKSRATADIVSRHPGMSLEPREDYESYKDLGEYKFVAVV